MKRRVVLNSYIFESTAPESAGINSKRIINFIKRLEDYCIDMHSLLIMKDKKLIFEAYYAPFKKDTLHRMFSVTKSLVSIAVGILSDKGLICLDDSITKYFPEYEPKDGFHPYLIETTIRDMLKMTTPHNSTTFDKHVLNDWSESYFIKEPTHRPGTIFSYDTSASHVLTALVEKLSGKCLLDFLRESGFKESGFSDDAYCMVDGAGVSQGGSGLMAYPMDLLVAADLVMNNGVVKDKQIVSREYISDAIGCQVPNFVKGSFLEEMQGYGYQFWRIRNNGFMIYGMAGQMAVCLPDKDLILVTTADTTDRKDGMQLIFESFWHEIYDYIDEDLDSDIKFVELSELGKNLEIKPLSSENVRVFNQAFEFKESNKLGLNKLEITTDTECGKLILDNIHGKQEIEFGFNSMRNGVFLNYNCPYTASGAWVDENTLVVKANLIGECIGKVIMQFSLAKPGAVTVFSRKTEQILFSEYSGFAQSV